MIYYKQIIDGKIIALVSYQKLPKSLPDSYVKISYSDYESILSEILASIPEPQPSNKPTYDELLEAYNILTGGNDNE